MERSAGNGKERRVPTTGKSSFRIYAATMIGRVLGLIRDRIIYGLEGYSVGSDVLNVGLRVATAVQAVLGEQALSASLVPAYSRRLGVGAVATPENARHLAGAAFARLAVGAGVLGFLGWLLAPWIASRVAPEGLDQAVDLVTLTLRFLMPMSAFVVLAAWCMAVLNSHRRFFLAYLAPAAWNCAILGALTLLLYRTSQPSVRDLVLYFSIGALVGGALQLAVQLPAAVRINGGLPLSLRSGVEGMAEFGRNFTPVFFGRGSLQVLSVAEGLLAVRFLATGSFSALQSSQRLFFLALLLCGLVQAIVYLPEFSREKAHGAFRSKAGEALGGVWFLTVPSAVGLLLFSYPVMAAAFRWRNYGDAENVLGAVILSVYALGLVPTASSRVLQSALYAQGRAKLAAWTSVGRSLISFGLAILAMNWWDSRPVAALSTFLPLEIADSALTLGALTFCTASVATAFGEWWFIRWRSGLLRSLDLMSRGVLFLALSGVSALVAGAVWWLGTQGITVLPAALRLPILGAAVVAAFAGSYLFLAWRLRLPEFDRLIVNGLRRGS